MVSYFNVFLSCYGIGRWFFVFFCLFFFFCVVFFQAEDGIRDLVRSRGLGDVYKRQIHGRRVLLLRCVRFQRGHQGRGFDVHLRDLAVDHELLEGCLLYTSDAADERSSVDLGGRRIIKKKILHD